MPGGAVPAQRRSQGGGAGVGTRAGGSNTAQRSITDRGGSKSGSALTERPSIGSGALTDYVKVRTCGRGSFGEALLVQHKATGRECVLKRVRVEAPEKEGQPAAAESALREVQVLWRLQHPNIVEFLGAFPDPRDLTGGTLCLLMAFCEGGDLQQRINRHRREGNEFTEAKVLRWFDALCSAVAYIHAAKVLHRDLKPSNIFLTGGEEDDSESVLIGDFGVSRPLTHALELVTTMVGTPCYLSPEVCKGKPYSFKSDIWSLGCVLFEMMVLRPPFGQACNLEALVSQIVRAEYVIPEGLAARFPEAIRCAKAMIRLDPEKRPTAQGLVTRPKIQSGSSGHEAFSPERAPPTSTSARSPTRTLAAAAAARAAAAANAAVAVALAPRARADKAQGRKPTGRILQAEAEPGNALQAWSECEQPTQPASRGRNAQQSVRGSSGSGLGSSPGSPGLARPERGGAMRRGASQGQLHANVPARSSMVAAALENSPPPRRGAVMAASPGAVKRGISQPVRRQLSNGARPPAGTDQSRRQPQVHRRQTGERVRSPAQQLEDEFVPSPTQQQHHHGQRGSQVTIATASDQRHQARQSAPSGTRSAPLSKQMSPRSPVNSPGVHSQGFNSDPKLGRRREDRAQHSQAFRDWLKYQRAGSPRPDDTADDNGAAGMEDGLLDAAAGGATGSTDNGDRRHSSHSGSAGLSGPSRPAHSPREDAVPSNSPQSSIGPDTGNNYPALSASTFPTLSPEVSRQLWTQTPLPSSGSEGLTADLIRTGGATDASTSLGSPDSSAPHSLSATARGSTHAATAETAHEADKECGDDPQSVSVCDRIEGIRACLEARLGTERFQKLYRSLSLDGDAATDSAPAAALPELETTPAEFSEKFTDAGSGCEDDAGSLALVAKLVDLEQIYFH